MTREVHSPCVVGLNNTWQSLLERQSLLELIAILKSKLENIQKQFTEDVVGCTRHKNLHQTFPLAIPPPHL